MFRRSVSAIAVACSFAAMSPAAADPNAGAYLAARQAETAHDFSEAARYFAESLIADPSNLYLLDNAIATYVSLGQIDRAVPVAEALIGHGHKSQIASLVLGLHNAKTDNWAALFTALEQGNNIGPLVDSLSQGWAHLGEGDMRRAITSFDRVIENPDMAIYGLTHKAYALASVGDFEGAAALFAVPSDNGMRYSRQSAIAHAQILSQLGRNPDAVDLLDRVFGSQRDPGLEALHGQLSAGEAVAYDAVRTPVQGLADLYHMIAGILNGDAPDAYTLLYARAAMYLAPEKTQAVLTTAQLLDSLGQYDLANAVYVTVSPDDPSFHAAELGRADVLRAAGRDDAAIEVLEALTRSHPDLPEVYATKGDNLRYAGRYDEAEGAYSQALALYSDDNNAKWFVHYTRGITHHKQDDWPAAEADFRAALSLRPDQPQVLNYLGYSLVERGEKLDEALKMIETAAAARPDNGAIIDSLGWVLFQMGQYEEAVVHLEQAAALDPVDPVINDHLGDALWAVGREIEAQFQWQRALSFDPAEAEADRIRDKLVRGLDLVLMDEGQAPIRLASGDN